MQNLIIELVPFPFKKRMLLKVCIRFCNKKITATYPYIHAEIVNRSTDNVELTYCVPFNKRKTFGDRGFRTAGPKLWNELPLSIRESETLDIFKKKLKIHYILLLYRFNYEYMFFFILLNSLFF